METIMNIIPIVLPIIFIGAIALFIIGRLKIKQKRGTLGKKKTTESQALLDSMIPLGMIFGVAGSTVFGIIFNVSLSNAIVFGAGLGLLLGYFAYEFYSKPEKSPS